jgi:hypothetical protein
VRGALPHTDHVFPGCSHCATIRVMQALQADDLVVGLAASRLSRDCLRWFARRRPPNRTCEFPRIRLSTGMPVAVFEQELQLLEEGGRIARGDPAAVPGSLDARRSVAVAGGADRRRVVEPSLPAGRPPARKVVASRPAPVAVRVLGRQDVAVGDAQLSLMHEQSPRLHAFSGPRAPHRSSRASDGSSSGLRVALCVAFGSSDGRSCR